MYYEFEDFNGSKEYFEGDGASLWDEMAYILQTLTPQLQPSGEKGKVGNPIFDPKATNAKLTESAAAIGWTKVRVPANLRTFGQDWDSGKGHILVEWQFSNYPFLWNNIIRSEAVYQSKAMLPPLTGPTEALIIVTKTGSIPASNSTLYYEQARAQVDTVTTLRVFEIPIRLVGLGVPVNARQLECDWNVYPARYSRETAGTSPRILQIRHGKRGQYGNQSITFLGDIK